MRLSARRRELTVAMRWPAFYDAVLPTPGSPMSTDYFWCGGRDLDYAFNFAVAPTGIKLLSMATGESRRTR